LCGAAHFGNAPGGPWGPYPMCPLDWLTHPWWAHWETPSPSKTRKESQNCSKFLEYLVAEPISFFIEFLKHFFQQKRIQQPIFLIIQNSILFCNISIFWHLRIIT
jgi:hypothetical protein